MDWKERALSLLKDSLEPVPSELNEIDWKSGLSDKTDRLAQHISAFANHLYGGMLVFGVNDDGSLFSLSKEQIDEIVKKLLCLCSFLCLSFIYSHNVVLY